MPLKDNIKFSNSPEQHTWSQACLPDPSSHYDKIQQQKGGVITTPPLAKFMLTQLREIETSPNQQLFG